MRKKLVLIDGHSLMFRAFHGMPAMTGPSGIATNAIYGFLRILFKILETEQPDYLAVAFDMAAPTFRHKMFADYKGTRKPAPPEFKEQQPVLKKILEAMGIPLISEEGWEADDILGTLASRAQADGLEAVIVSGDHDLLQIADEHIRITIPSTKGGQTEMEHFYAADVLAQYQVTPLQFIDVKALMGDTSDNIPGLPGVGKVTATKLIVAYGSIENAHAHVDEIKPNKARLAMEEHYDLAVLSKELATIRKDAPVTVTWEDCVLGDIYTPEVYTMFKELNFKSFFERFNTTEEKPAADFAFRVITTAAEFHDLCAEASRAPAFGISLACEKDPAAAGKAISGKEKGGLDAEADGQLSFIFENEPVDPTPHFNDTLMGVALSIENGAVPETAACLLNDDLTEEVVGTNLRKLLGMVYDVRSLDVKTLLKYMNATAGSARFGSFTMFDGVLAAYLLNPLKSDYDYDAIAAEYLGETLASKEELIGKKGYRGSKTPEKIPEVLAYEAYTALKCRAPLEKALMEAGMTGLFNDVEMPLIDVLADMETDGILVNPEELKVYGDGLTSRIEALRNAIFEGAGCEFNINSPKQLGEILFEKMQLPGGKKTKTGYSTAADVLEKLAPEQPVVADILEYRQLTKLKSTYADGLAAFIDGDGRIRTTFNQTITATGRLSSTDPNLQNIPMRMEMGRRIRKCFIPKPGCIFVDADYSQIELRILAHMSGDEELIAAYRDARDIHRITASQVFHVPFDEVTDQQRRNAKAVNFGIIYGISSFGLSQGLSITPKEADQYIKDYFKAYPSIHAYLQGMVTSAKETGYAVSLFGRRRPVPELRETNFMRRAFGERVAMNSPIQGTAADIMKIAMVRVANRLKQENMASRLILQIHDELLIEAPEEEAEKAAMILQEEMAAAAHLSVALETDCHTGTDWYEAK
ncbi:MAG: DNA polymerase I [Lachnospiraceae bacterium]|nr:DNA polymerase I [Lachnospiraceae bacterium]